MSTVPEQLRSALASCAGANRYLIAFSGGMDSSVLLHAAAASVSRHSHTQLRALHVHHGLHDDADDWTRHCREFCAKLRIPIDVCFAGLVPAAGESVEAEARRVRYRLLQNSMQANDVLLMAHHGDDQLETMMLRLLRGAGVRGLAGMPRLRRLGPGQVLRPFLDLPRRDLALYAEKHGLSFLEDPSNGDERFDRGFLRGQVLGPLLERWPGLPRTAARSARHLVAGAELLDDLGAMDLESVRAGDNALLVSALNRLSENRRNNVLRYWIRQRGFEVPSSARLAEVSTSVLTAARDARPCVAWPGAELRRYLDRLYLMPPLPEAPGDWQAAWDTNAPLMLPGRAGCLSATAATGPGLDAALLESGSVSVRFRSGGERLRPAGRLHHTTLSRFFQERRVVPWMRERVPLIYIEGQLAAVADLCTADGFSAAEQGACVRLAWDGHPPLTGF